MNRRISILCAGAMMCGFAAAAAHAMDDSAANGPAVESFRVIEKKVNIPEVPWCPADWDHSGTVTIDDLFPFLDQWFSGSCGGDVNWDGRLTVQDIFDFMTMLANGSCPPVQTTSGK